MAIAAIETRYAGCRFRSRTEARWARFFDHMGIVWEYEPQGYTLASGRRYLPDFLLPQCRTWIEVKGSDDQLDRQLLLDAAKSLPRTGDKAAEDGPLIMLLGPIPRPIKGVGDWGWTAFEEGQEGHSNAMRYGFGSFHKNTRPWFLDNAQYLWKSDSKWTVPLWDIGESGVPDAYTAARSARFEHGECG